MTNRIFFAGFASAVLMMLVAEWHNCTILAWFNLMNIIHFYHRPKNTADCFSFSNALFYLRKLFDEHRDTWYISSTFLRFYRHLSAEDCVSLSFVSSRFTAKSLSVPFLWMLAVWFLRPRVLSCCCPCVRVFCLSHSLWLRLNAVF